MWTDLSRLLFVEWQEDKVQLDQHNYNQFIFIQFQFFLLKILKSIPITSAQYLSMI